MGTHFSSGVTNVDKQNAMAILRQPDPSVYYEQNFDFFDYVAGQWVVTETDAGSTEAIVSGAGGLLAITNASAGATDAAQIQWAGNSGAAVLTTYWDQAKDLVIKARFKVSDATNTAFLIGQGTVDTSIVASLPTDGIYFYKAGASTILTAAVRKAGTSSSINLGTMANDTFVEVALNYSASQLKWSGWWNNLQVGSISGTDNSPTNGLAIAIGLLNASAAAHVLTVDYLNVLVQR